MKLWVECSKALTLIVFTVIMEFGFELVKQNLLKTVYMIMKAVNFVRQFYRIILLFSNVTFDFFRWAQRESLS